MVFALPLIHLSAHFFGFAVRIIEYSPRGCGVALKRAGLFCLLVFPTSFWLAVTSSYLWASLAFTSFLAIGLCGYLLERLEEEELR